MQAGQTLLHYRLVEKIGEGGMGVVWKALDTSLNREVAIKVLPQAFYQDHDRVGRFEREARLLASLNHPNIATIHGLHEAPTPDSDQPLRFLAMEMVEGEDLASRLQRGRMAVDDVLSVSSQIAAALEAAHAQGVVHRDLKPANVMLTAAGAVKVLDFGLAKAMEPDASSSSASLALSPTITSMGTAAGMILGTAAYMSPEQARGKPVDRRTDLWAFGCVLYECLTGVQLFRGETVSDSLAAILRKDPDWSGLPDDTPRMVRLLTRRCLTRDPRKRLQDAGDARIELEQAIEDPQGESLGLGTVPIAAGREAKRGWMAWVPWALFAVAIILAAFFASRGGAPPTGRAIPSRLMIPVPGATDFGDLAASPPAVSPDGRHVVFGAIDENGDTSLLLRPLGDFTARRLDDTRGASYAFWSPDSRHIGFFLGGRLKRLEVSTGRVQSIAEEGSSYPRGGAWNSLGQIIFAPNSNTGIHLIDTAGGPSRQITTPDPEIPDGSHRWPCFLPDGDGFLFVTWTNDLDAREQYGGVYATSISGGQEPVRVVPDASSVAYVFPGYLLVLRGDNLIAIPFDAQARRVTGEVTVVASDVMYNTANGHAAFSASTNGTLVHAAGMAFLPATLNWYDREGTVTEADSVDVAPYSDVRLAPDAKRAAAVLPGESGDGHIWIVDLVRGVRTRLVHGAWQHDYPMWSGDGARVLYASQENGSLDLFVTLADGSGRTEPVFVDNHDKVLYDWSRDGHYAAYWPLGSGSGTPDLWIYSLERKEAAPLIESRATFQNARFSPDTRHVAFESDDSGRMEIYVQALGQGADPRGGARWQVSTAGGEHPHWRDDGREITYVDLERRVMAVSVEDKQGRLTFGKPRELFQVYGLIVTIDATGDHERFLVATREAGSSEPLRVILDWPAELETRASGE